MQPMMKFNPASHPQGVDRWYNIATNAATRHAEIYLYGVIGGWNANAQQFLADLQSAGDVDTITVYLNTVGGSFYDGLPIYNTLKQHKARVTVKVMGYALSIGSVIMLAADTVEAAENSLIMIHRAQGGVWGDADDMAHAAQVLLKHEKAVLPDYMRKLGKTETDVQALLQAETWYTAAEAKAAGLVDVVVGNADPNQAAADMQGDSWKYATQHFTNIPPTLLNRINQSMTEEDNTMKPEDIQAIATAVMQAMTAEGAVSQHKYDELETDYNDLKARAGTLKAENTSMRAELAALKAEVPNNAHLQGIVTGPAGHSFNGCF